MVKTSYFQGRKVVITTKHKKESVIGPALEKAFGMEYVTTDKLDTDLFGTFSGEIERTDIPVEAARQKCIWGMDECQVDLAIGSEGSFGPHPDFFFLPAGEEILVLMDRKNDLEIKVKLLTPKTNFSSLTITTETNVADFLTHAQFPSHGLILRKSANDISLIEKGIHDEKQLINRINWFLQNFGTCYLETDMRAMHNPSRMQAIAELTEKLIVKMKHCCPKCHMPGFSITDVLRGLICSNCAMPTHSIQSLIYTCSKCNYTTLETYPGLKKMEDPMFCDYCNP